MKFSANLGFLWTELSLIEAIEAAAKSSFDAVECHWPYQYTPEAIKAALHKNNIKMISLNSARGSINEMGMLAIVGREKQAKASIIQALDYAATLEVPNVHLLAGFASGAAAHDCFIDNIRYACELARPKGITILIEPLNNKDAPGYFLQTAEQAHDIITELAEPNLRLLFDIYHMQQMGGDICSRLKKYLPIIGHIQIASVPDRGTPAPGNGEVNYGFVLAYLQDLGWHQAVGAEYKPKGTTEESLGWLEYYHRS
jgi:hydroxypyruvate isomerase